MNPNGPGREVITVQVGECGNKLGTTFWQEISGEHCISPIGAYEGNDDTELDRLAIMWNESSTGRFVPRNLLCDMEPSCLNGIRDSKWGSLFHPNAYVFTCIGAQNNWTKGYMNEGQLMVDVAMEGIRKQAEMCVSLLGFQIIHAISGGTGGGAGSRLLEEIQAFYSTETTLDVSVFPSIDNSDIVVEPYNAILSLSRLIDSANQCICMDNQCMFDVVQRAEFHKGIVPTFKEVNTLASMVLSGGTSSLRFPGTLNMDIRKLMVNLVPFPRLHFYASSMAPIVRDLELEDHVIISVANLINAVFHPNNFMNKMKLYQGKFFSTSMTYRGNIPSHEINDQTQFMKQRYREAFVKWIPHNIKSAIVDKCHVGFYRTISCLGNTTALGGFFGSLADKFSTLFNKKAFMHWFTREGLDEQEMLESFQNCIDLIDTYKTYVSADDDE